MYHAGSDPPLLRKASRLLLVLISLAAHACATGSPAGPLPASQSAREPSPSPAATQTPGPPPLPVRGLEGSWQDPATATVHTIVWDGAGYRVVSSINLERGEYPITGQQWDGDALTWTYLVLSTGVSVTFRTVRLAGDALTANWRSTNGDSGGEILQRVPGPPRLPGPSSAAPGNGSEPMPGLAGVWRDAQEGNTHTIEWDGDSYHTSSMNDEHGSYEITQEYWDGSAFTWTYLVPQTGVSVTIQATLVDGETLYLSWWSTNGRSGTDAFSREP